MDLSDVEYISGSASSSGPDTEEEEYGELLELTTPIPLEPFIQQFFATASFLKAEVKEKIRQYTVTKMAPTHPHFFGLSREGDNQEYFAKYDLGDYYEGEKRSHEVLDPLNCPSIIKMKDVIPINDGGIIITPLYRRYDYTIFRAFRQTVMKQLLEAIKVCHDSGIAHRDIKPANVVWRFVDVQLSSIEIFLTDFALACFDFSPYKNKTINEMPGTQLYSSPEKLRGEIPPDPRVCDIFAAGVFFMELLRGDGRHVFADRTVDGIFLFLSKIDFWFGSRPPSTLDLLKRMIEDDYTKRITVTEALEHEYFKEKIISSFV